VHDHGTPSASGPWWISGLVVVVPVLLYVSAVRIRRARMDRSWSPLRLAAFVLGTALVGAAVSPPLAAFAHSDPVGHMLQHLLMGMYAPLAVVVSAPVTLALGASAAGPRRVLARLLHSRAAGLLGRPVVAAGAHLGGLFAVYLTPLHRAAFESAPVHAAVTLHFFLAGCLYAWAIARPDPAPRRPGVGVRATVLLVSAGGHAFLAKLLYARAAELSTGAGFPAERMEQAAVWMYYGGDLAELALSVLLFGEWYRRRARADERRAVLRRGALT
jgi:putative membrane protein